MEEQGKIIDWNGMRQSEEIIQELKDVKQIIRIYAIVRIVLQIIIVVALVMVSVGVNDMAEVMMHYVSHYYGCHGVGY